jgi:hypothetical protein
MKHNPFTKTGAEFFTHSALGDIFSEMDKGNEPPNIIITVGRRSIEIPTNADIWEELEEFLKNTLEELEEAEQC